MKRTRILFRLLFHRGQHGFSSFAFVLLLSLLSVMASVVRIYPAQKALSDHSFMSANSFVVTVTDEPIDLENGLSEGERIFEEKMEESGFSGRIESHETGLVFRSSRQFIKMVYIPVEQNINDFGEIHSGTRDEKDVFYFRQETSPDLGNTFLGYRFHSYSLDEEPGKYLFVNPTVVFSDWALVERQKEDLEVQGFVFDVHLKDELTIEDGCFLERYTVYGLPRKFTQCYEPYRDMYVYNTLYVTLSETLVLLVVFLTIAFVFSWSLSQFLLYRKRSQMIGNLEALGMADSTFVGMETISTCGYGLLGYLAFLVPMAILRAVPIFGNCLEWPLFFLPLSFVALVTFVGMGTAGLFVVIKKKR